MDTFSKPQLFGGKISLNGFINSRNSLALTSHYKKKSQLHFHFSTGSVTSPKRDSIRGKSDSELISRFLHFLDASRLLEHLFYGPGDTMKFFFEIKVFKNFIFIPDETLVAQESNIMTKFLSEIPKIHENPQVGLWVPILGQVSPQGLWENRSENFGLPYKVLPFWGKNFSKGFL